jgi:hypothetical protein
LTELARVTVWVTFVDGPFVKSFFIVERLTSRSSFPYIVVQVGYRKNA